MSVVIIFLDEAEFLSEAVESVVAQDVDDWELLLCDDGSTDGSGDIARRWAATDTRISVLEHPGGENRGMSATRNLGLRHARGEYLALLDADDVWTSDKLRAQIAVADAHPEVAVVAGASRYWQSWSSGDPSDDVVVPVGAPTGRVLDPPTLSTTLYPLGPGAAPCPSDLLLRRDAVEAVGGFEEHFRGARQMYEDQGFLAKLYLRYPAYVLDGCRSWYRQRPESCVATVTAEGGYHHVRRYFLDWFAGHLADADVVAPAVHEALGRARGRYQPVTVVVPTKDRPETLHRTIRTILAQRDVSLRVVVVDDGSGTPVVVEDPRVRVVRHETCQGVAAARNRGLDEVDTPWVAFCDDDDLWLPDKLARQLDALARSTDASWCAVGAAIVDEDLELLSYRRPRVSGRVDRELLGFNRIPGGGSGVLVDTELVRQVGGFDTRFSLVADWDLYIRLALVSPLVTVDEPLVAYVKHVMSMTSLDRAAHAALDEIRDKYRDERRDRALVDDDAAYHLWVGNSCRDRGDRTGARQAYLRALRSDPGWPPLRALLTTVGRRLPAWAERRRIGALGGESAAQAAVATLRESLRIEEPPDRDTRSVQARVR